MTFIDEELFHDKRSNLTIYEGSRSILLTQVLMTFIEGEVFHDKRTTLILYKTLPVNFIGTLS
jgi:hypothetical protein